MSASGFVTAVLGQVTLAEPGVYLIAACLPTYRNIFRSIKEHTGFAKSGNKTGDSWPSRNDLELSGVPSKYRVKSSSNGYEDIDNQDLISRRTGLKSDPSHVRGTGYHSGETGDDVKKGGIHVKSEIIVEDLSHSANSVYDYSQA